MATTPKITQHIDTAVSHNELTLPLVSIGLPIYNELKYIEKSINSLLKQDYKNIEIIISDNASDDGTKNIINRLCQSDKRIKLHYFNKNQGAIANFQYVYNAATGNYFMWASGHDLWTPNLISECVTQLQSQPDAVIAYATPEWVDSTGNLLQIKPGWTDTRGIGTIGRFFSVLWGSMNPVLGLIRRDALPNIEKTYSGVGADLVLLLELSLKGDFIHAYNARFSRRQPRGIETYSQKLQRYKHQDVGIVNSRLLRIFPLFKLPFGILSVIFRANISWYNRIGILLILFPSLPIRYVTGRFSK